MPISVLVVEDQAEIREVVKNILENEGYEVNCAADSEEAIDFLNRLPRPCILLWDALTPRQSLSLLDETTMDGVHVATIPVSVVTVIARGSERTVAKRLTSEEAILSVVREHCPLKKAANA